MVLNSQGRNHNARVFMTMYKDAYTTKELIAHLNLSSS